MKGNVMKNGHCMNHPAASGHCSAGWRTGSLIRRGQRGVTLLEVLVSIVVMALGLLGILGTQMRTLADTQTGVRRAQAIRLIEDLSERMHANPSAINSAALNNYVIGWSDAGSAGACPDPAGCTSADLATDQIKDWKLSVEKNLPPGNAMTFLVGGANAQLGVLISWHENERSTDTDYTKYFKNTALPNIAGVACPDNQICHLQYISVTARCPTDPLSGSANPLVFCADGVASLPSD